MLSSNEDWIWDSWVADDGERYHLFFLKAPRVLGDPDLRHHHARIGHASSLDLVDWEVHEDALGPADTGFDSLALWTGSVARGADGIWRLYYSALNTEGRGIHDQRVGMAESDDLMTWRRVGTEQLVAPDGRWYWVNGDGTSGTWRDPFVYRDGDGWHMLITARAAGAERRFDGVLAHARSTDMRRWELGPPLTRPAHFGQHEVSQVRCVDGQWLLVFTCHPDEQADPRPFCTWYALGESALGPFDVASSRPFEEEPSLFAAPLVQRRDGSWAFIGFREPASLEIGDPIGVQLTEGTLRRSAPGP